MPVVSEVTPPPTPKVWVVMISGMGAILGVLSDASEAANTCSMYQKSGINAIYQEFVVNELIGANIQLVGRGR